MNPNDFTEWAGEHEAPIKVFKRPVSKNGIVDPNQGTAWASPEEMNPPGTKVKRAIDTFIESQTERKCAKCGFSTLSEDSYKAHVEEVDGMIRCERERKRFAVEEKKGGTIDTAALAKTVAEEVAKAVQPGFMMLAEALKGLAPQVPPTPSYPPIAAVPVSASKAKEKRHVRTPGMVRGGTGAVEPFVVGDVEQSDQPMADPLPESEETL